MAPTAWCWSTRTPVTALPGFADGVVSVQDAAAQQAAARCCWMRLACSGAGAAPLRVLDACAAPGGKTAHLLELADAHVTALDVDPQRCERIHDRRCSAWAWPPGGWPPTQPG
jgi:16S rRNA (cytosine967-C5)-methyltransferase